MNIYTRIIVSTKTYQSIFLQDSFESKTSNRISEMGSTSYIIPLRSESDEEVEEEPLPQPEKISFRNKVAPTSPFETQLEPKLVRSRSPLFRAKSREYERSEFETEINSTTTMHTTTGVSVIDSTEMFIRKETETAKMKRSIFSNKSNSASTSGNRNSSRPSKPSRSSSAKMSKNSK